MVGSGRSTGTRESARVVVVDDHPFFRDGLIRGLRESGYLEVVGEASTGREGLEVIAGQRPDVAVLDYQMPDLTGLDVVHAIVRQELPTRALILSAVTDSAIVFRALEEGAQGYLSKEARRSEIVDAVRRVSQGETVVPPELAAGLADQIRLRAASAGPVLSEREQQVLSGFARGLSIPELAAELYLGVSTVKTHAQRLYQKLGVSDRAAAVAEGMRRGLLE
jgi:two-component system, NarL family, nitrate/nitrite response regulator NarL